jgi:hypothetical protein
MFGRWLKIGSKTHTNPIESVVEMEKNWSYLKEDL